MIILIAYSPRAAEDYAHKNRIAKCDYHILTRTHYLRGVYDVELRWLHGWRLRRDADEINDFVYQMRLRGRIKKDVFVSREDS